jgi:predicted hydrocarbon binding protein
VAPVARLVKVSQQELDSVRKLYESVMSYACHGLFFREGMVLADELLKNAPQGQDLLSFGKQLILDRGWAEDVLFTDRGAKVRGSIEASPGSEMETCHRLRGILSKILEAKTKQRVRLNEVECVSTGAKECVFEREGST